MKARRYPSDDPVTLYDAWRAGAFPRLPDGFWRVESNARAVLEALLRRDGHSLDNAPMACRRLWFDRHRLSTLLSRVYRGSPSLLLLSLYPGRWTPADFPEVPKARDLQEAAFRAEGVTRPDDRFGRWNASRELRKERQNKCLFCDRPREPGRPYCAAHLEYLRRRSRETYRNMRETGTCFRCHTRSAVHGGVCETCWQKQLVVKARQARKYYRRQVQAGLCAHKNCTARPEPGHVYCDQHLAEQRMRSRRYYQRRERGAQR
ncbi:MAG: hypothetical protein ACM3ZA_14870 [Bacillota bacterium]